MNVDPQMVAAFIGLCGVIAFLYKSAQARQDRLDTARETALKVLEEKWEHKQLDAEVRCREESWQCREDNRHMTERINSLEGKQTVALENIALSLDRQSRALEKMTEAETELLRAVPAFDPHDIPVKKDSIHG